MFFTVTFQEKRLKLYKMVNESNDPKMVNFYGFVWKLNFMIDFNQGILKIYKSCDLKGIPENRKLQKKQQNTEKINAFT